MKRKFKKLVNTLEREFVTSKGYITCEFSIPIRLLKDKRTVKYLKNGYNRMQQLGRWEVFECNTCRGYHNNRPYHLHLIRNDSNQTHNDYIDLLR